MISPSDKVFPYPSPGTFNIPEIHEGITLRTWMATKLFAAMVGPFPDAGYDAAAEAAVEASDFLIQALNAREKENNEKKITKESHARRKVMDEIRTIGIDPAKPGSETTTVRYKDMRIAKLHTDEPIFILLGRDKLARRAIEEWIIEAGRFGVNHKKIVRAHAALDSFIQFQQNHRDRVKLPD